MSPRTSSLCSLIFLVLRDQWLYVCLHLKMEFRSCARGRQWCGIFHYHWWTASIKPRLLYSYSGLVSWGLPFLQFNKQKIIVVLVIFPTQASVSIVHVYYGKQCCITMCIKRCSKPNKHVTFCYSRAVLK